MNMDHITKRLKQVVLEDTYSRSNIRTHVRRDVMLSIDKKLKKKYKKCVKSIRKYQMKNYYKSKNERVALVRPLAPEDIAIEVMLAVAENTKEVPIQNTATKLAFWLEYDDIFNGVKTAAELLTVCANSNLYDIYPDPVTIRARFKLPKKTRRYIDDTRYMNPMICNPDAWTNNINGGYISVCQNIILGSNNKHRDKQALDAINTVQNIEWELDEVMVNYKEKSKKPLDTKQKRSSWKQHTKMSRKVYQELLDQGNSFYFVWRYDFRGRMYSQGYYVNLQSTSYKKGLLNFKKQEIIK